MLTLNEIRNVNFRKSNFGGYRAEDVEAFIDEVQLSYDSLLKENAELVKRLESLTSKLEQYQQEENSIRDALMNAQKVGDASMRDAKHKAELILKDATIKAEKIVSNAQIEIHREREVIERMQRDIADFKANLLKLYKEHLTLINSIPNEEIMRPETRDAVGSVPMLDRDTSPYAGSQSDYSFAPMSERQQRYDSAPDYGYSDYQSAPAVEQDYTQAGGYPAPQSAPIQSEQPIMPRERLNQSRGGFTVNIDDDYQLPSTQSMPSSMREQQGYSAFDGVGQRDRFAPQPMQTNDFGGAMTGGDSSNIFAASDGDFGMNDEFAMPSGTMSEDNVSMFRRRRN